MKKIFLLLFFLISFSFAEINEYVSDVYFANGIDTSEDDAKLSINDIDDSVKVKHPEAYKTVNDWKVSYNHTHGIGIDFYEAMLQKIDEEWYIKQALKFSKILNLTVSGLLKMAAQKAAKEQMEEFVKKQAKGFAQKIIVEYGDELNMFKGWTQQQIEALFQRIFKGLIDKIVDSIVSIPEDVIKKQAAEDIKKQFASYTKSIKDGHGVVVIAHSQGNLFTNLAYDMFTNHWIPWDEDTEWMKIYFSSYAVASPANDVLGKSETDDNHITFDNDIIRWTPSGLSANIENPKRDYIDINGTRIDNPFSIEAHAFLTSYMATDITRGKILDFINEKVVEQRDDREKRPSQWKIEKLQGCPGRCDARLALKHISMNDYGFNFNPIELNDMVIPFMPRKKIEVESYFGKLYKVKDSSARGKYVKADTYGYRLEDNNTEGICQDLVDEEGKMVAQFEGEAYPTPPDTVRGPVMVKLSWDQCYGDVDLDLDVRWNTGYLDVHDDKNASFEHFVIEDEKYIIPRETPYAVYATDKTDHSLIDASQIVESENPIDISVLAVTPTDTQLFETQVTSLHQLNLGHILDITVKGKLEIIYPTRDYNGGGGGSIQRDDCEGSFNCKCIPCDYTITNFLKMALLGPISNGKVKISNTTNNTIVYTGSTTTGRDIVTTGIIDIPNDILETFVDEDIYLIEIEGGEDIDSNDDFYVDINPVQNNGVMHAIVTGKELKYLSFKVNILTEIAYQVSKDKIKGSNVELKVHLDQIAKNIFRHKVFLVDESIELNYLDVLTWVPTLDKKSLKKDYDTHVEPIVQKVYANEDRLQDAYEFVYETVDSNAPELATAYMEVCSMAPSGTVLGNMEIITNGDEFINNVTLSGEGANNFSADENAKISVSAEANLSQKPFYTLEAVATNKNNHSSLPVELNIRLINTIGDMNASIPYLKAMDIQAVDENTIEGTIVGKVLFADEENDIVSIDIENNSTNFEISVDGTIFVKEGADIDYEKEKTITLKVIATNSMGNSSCPVVIHLKINDLIDTPAFELFSVIHIDENITIGTNIGALKLVRDSIGDISSIDILNSDVPFSIDVNGSIITTGYIDYERETEYNLIAIARSSSGDSGFITINIYVDDILETGMPIVEDFAGSVDENVEEGTIVGALSFEHGESPVQYMELSGFGSDDFYVDSNGTIFVRNGLTLDYERRSEYVLTVISHNSQGNSIAASVHIMLNNLEDTAPILNNFRGKIVENSVVGTVIGVMDINMTGVAPIKSMILSGSGAETFNIDSNGTVSLVYPVDYEYKNIYYLQVQAMNDSGISQAVNVTIDVLNIIDHVPVLQYNQGGNFLENTPIGSVITKVGFLRSGDRPITYKLHNTSVFSIDNEGTITLNTSLDYETKRKYDLKVVAINSIGESSDVTVTIHVLNVFEPGIQTFEIIENAAIGTIVGTLEINNTNIEEIESITLDGVDSEIFSIDVNGTIKLKLPIDYEIEQNYYFNTIVDINGITLKIPLEINVLNVLDHIPMIFEYQYPIGGIMENAAIGSVIGRVKMLSSGDNASSYTLSDTSVFQIDDNGVITLNAVLDYEIQRSYTLFVVASNYMGESLSTPITISVLNVLEGGPILEKGTFKIVESTTIGTIVGTVLVHRHGYSKIESMVLRGRGSAKFSIDSNGTVKLVETLDYEKGTGYQFEIQVEAINSHGISLAVPLEIKVLNAVDKVPFLEPFGANVEENATIGKVVGRLTVDNLRGDSATSYTLNDTSVFYIYNNGSIILNATLDYETQRSYSLSVVASNDIGDSLPLPITINVLKILDGGAVLNDTAFSIEENTTIGTTVGTVEIISEGDSQIESMVLIGRGSEKFSIDSNGTIKLVETLDYESEIGYQLKVEAINSYGSSLAVSLDIEVVNIVDNIPGIVPFNESIEENAIIGSVIGRVKRCKESREEHKICNIGDDPINYRLSDTSVFKIDSNGVITLNSMLDYEMQQRYDLFVIASNSIGDSESVSVTIEVLNLLEFGPILKFTTLSIVENSVIGTILGTIEVASRGGSGIEYMSLSGIGSRAFSVDKNGTVKLVLPIDYEIRTHYDLDVVATNSHGSSFPRSVKINVLDILNDNPVLNDTIFDIKENATVGTIVGIIDINNTGTATIEYMTLRGLNYDMFSIDANGVVRLSILLDYEHKNIYTFNVSATNAHGDSPFSSLTINVLNILDVPSLKEFTAYVEENASIGTDIGKIEPFSEIDGKIVSYQLSDTSMFDIDNNGTIILKSMLDYEKQTQYYLEVVAVNAQGQSNPTSVVINVTNILDGEPVLKDATFNVEENTIVGAVIGTVDINSTGGSVISSMRLYGTGAYHFTIDNNGTVRLMYSVDYENKIEYHLYASATNTTGNSSAVNVLINILNSIDEIPIIDDFKGFIEDNATTASIIGTVNIETSGDSPITSFILSGEGSENFTIDSNGTIRVSTEAVLDETVKKTYDLKVHAENLAGNSEQKDVIIVLTHDKDIPEVPSTFEIVDSTINSLTLRWQHNSNTAKGFKLEVNGANAIVLDQNISTYEVTGLFPDTTYIFELKALNDRGESQGVVVEGTTAYDPSAVERLREVLEAKCGRYSFSADYSYDTFYSQFDSNTGVYTESIECYNAGFTDNDLLLFHVLKGIRGSLRLDGNNLSNLAGLKNLLSLGYSLDLENNPNLTDLAGLKNLISVGRNLYLYNNPSLTNISGISNIRGYNGQGLYIDFNQYTIKADMNSSFCSTTWNLNGVDDMSQVCEGFGPYVHSAVEKFKDSLRSACYIYAGEFYANFDIENGIYNGDLDCTYYAENEDLIDFKVLKKVTGDLDLSYSYLTNVDGLNNLTTVGGDFGLSENYLVNLNDLSNLISIGGDFRFEDNDLSSLAGLENLTFVGGELHFDDNPSLVDVSAIGNIAGIDGERLFIDFSQYTTKVSSYSRFCSTAWDVIDGRYNSGDMIEVCDGIGEYIYTEHDFLKQVLKNKCDVDNTEFFDSFDIDMNIFRGDLYCDGVDMKDEDLLKFTLLEEVTGDFTLYGNELTNLDGLVNLTRVGEDFEVDNNYLTNVDGLSNLATVGDGIYLYSNLLDNVDGLSSLTAVGGDFELDDNHLTNLDVLSHFTEINGDFYLSENNLTNVDALSNLSTVEGSFYLSENNLTNLDGIANLMSIGGSFEINKNPHLIDMSGVSNVEGVEGNRLYIDLGQYEIKADNTKSFCATSWNIYNGTTDIVDDMSVVCSP